MTINTDTLLLFLVKVKVDSTINASIKKALKASTEYLFCFSSKDVTSQHYSLVIQVWMYLKP